MTRESWIAVGRRADIPKNGARVVKTEFCDIAIFRTVDDHIYALEDRCPHQGGVLSAGIVHDAQVTCPLHNWVIELASGAVVGPDEGCARSVPARVTDGQVEIDLSALRQRSVAA